MVRPLYYLATTFTMGHGNRTGGRMAISTCRVAVGGARASVTWLEPLRSAVPSPRPQRALAFQHHDSSEKNACAYHELSNVH